MPLVKKKIILKKKGGQSDRTFPKELNDVETQTDDMSVNEDQLGFETKELFVLKSKWINETTKKTIEIHDFILKIEDEDKKLKIASPRFKLAGKEFSIIVYPDNEGSGFIAVCIANCSNEDQMTSITVQETSGVERSWEMNKIQAGKGAGFIRFLSHDDYRELAKVNGDVLRLEVVLTLHRKGEADGWTR